MYWKISFQSLFLSPALFPEADPLWVSWYLFKDATDIVNMSPSACGAAGLKTDVGVLL